VNAATLALFAIRVGVDGRRAANLMDWTGQEVSGRIVAVLVDQREPRFAQTFVNRAAAIGEWEYPTVLVGLVAKHGLPVPQQAPYLRSWLEIVTKVFAGYRVDHGGVLPVSGAEQFAAHVGAWVAARLPAKGLGAALVEGVARGWLDRSEAVRLVLSGLDTAPRPIDRKTWLSTWLDGLGATDAEIVAQTDALVPVLAAGDSQVIARLAPILVAGTPDETLADVVTAALSATTKKSQRMVLTALMTRPRPSPAIVEVIGPQVTALDTGRDAGLRRAVASIVERWEISPSAPRSTVVSGMWQPTPSVWIPPRFDRGEETADALARLTAELVQRPAAFDEPDVLFERFLSVANAVARHDPAAVRVVLRGVADDMVQSWVKNRPIHPSGDPLEARKGAVLARLGEIPCLLSEPSAEDLHVSATDLVDRLRAYQALGASVSEPDLFLALTRLDTSPADAQVVKELGELAVPVVLSFEPMAVTAGPAVALYLEGPAVEPEMVCEYDVPYYYSGGYTHKYTWESLLTPGLLRAFAPRRVWAALTPSRHSFLMKRNAVFPSWGDQALCWFWEFCGGDVGPAVRQVVRRAAPLPPGSAANLLELATLVDQSAVADVATAVAEAWERGLLRPGVPDLNCLDWHSPKLAARAKAFADAAQDGLLSVVWPLLDELAARATGAIPSLCRCGRRYQVADRLIAGAAEVVAVIADLLPEVQHAVTTGLADPSALELPGVRALAARPGSSQAVKTARAIVAQLPAEDVQPPES